MIGADYHDYGSHGPNAGANAMLAEYWRRGGLVTISNHAGNPRTGGNVFDRRIRLSELLDKNSAAHRRWMAELDVLAEGLRDLDLFLTTAGIDLVALDGEQAQAARRAFSRFGKGRHRAGLNYGDCFSYALAIVGGEPLLFKGNDFVHTDVEPVDCSSLS